MEADRLSGEDRVRISALYSQMSRFGSRLERVEKNVESIRAHMATEHSVAEALAKYRRKLVGLLAVVVPGVSVAVQHYWR